MFKKLLFLILLVAILPLANCGKRQEGDKTQVTFWHAMGGPLGKSLDGLVERFNQSNPQIHIQSVSMGTYTALSQKIMASISAGNPPTIAQVYENWTMELIDGGALVPVQELMDGDTTFRKEDLDDFFPVFLEGNTYRDTLWTFPFNKGLPALYYNGEMFRKAGLDPNTPPRTWKEFLNYAQNLTVDTNGDGTPDQWGTAFSIPTCMTIFQSILLQNGGEILDQQQSRALFTSPIGIEALRFLVDLVKRYKVTYITSGAYEHQTDFAARRVAMIQGHIVSLTYMKPQLTFTPGIAPIPQGKNKAVMITGTNIAIFKSSTPAQREAAWKFIRWFTDTPQTAQWSKETNYVPVRRSALETPALQEKTRSTPGLKETMMQIEYAVGQPKCAAWYEGRRYLEEDAIEGAMRGYVSPEKGLKKAAHKLDQELQKKR